MSPSRVREHLGSAAVCMPDRCLQETATPTLADLSDNYHSPAAGKKVCEPSKERIGAAYVDRWIINLPLLLQRATARAP